jgi:hypothetical protein
MVLCAPHLRFHKCCSAQWFTACDQRLYPAPFPIFIKAYKRYFFKHKNAIIDLVKTPAASLVGIQQGLTQSKRINIMLPTITDTALNALNAAASRIQAELLDRTGEWYEVPDLNDVLARWLEGAIESLCEDACELCVTGERTYASFNRAAFEGLLQRLPAVNTWEQRAELIEQAKDQAAIALDRVA